MEVIKQPVYNKGDHVTFVYNGKIREGVIERVGQRTFTIKHSHPERLGNKKFSTYRFVKVTGGTVNRV